MPNRIIKESICTSEDINSISWFEEVVFYRLIVNCDDYGRLDARASILKSRLFPLKDGITSKQIEAALSKLSTAGMVQVYEYDQKPFLQLINWGKHQTIRNKRSKYPEPSAIEINCKQLQANVSVIQSESESESESILSSAQPPSANFTDDSDEMKLCHLLAERMRLNKPDCKLPDSFQGWCKHIDLMMRIDGRTPRQIQDVILFCQKDSFWQSNILSTKKLREKFDQLALKMQEKRPAAQTSNPFKAILERGIFDEQG